MENIKEKYLKNEEKGASNTDILDRDFGVEKETFYKNPISSRRIFDNEDENFKSSYHSEKLKEDEEEEDDYFDDFELLNSEISKNNI